MSGLQPSLRSFPGPLAPDQPNRGVRTRLRVSQARTLRDVGGGRCEVSPLSRLELIRSSRLLSRLKKAGVFLCAVFLIGFIVTKTKGELSNGRPIVPTKFGKMAIPKNVGISNFPRGVGNGITFFKGPYFTFSKFIACCENQIFRNLRLKYPLTTTGVFGITGSKFLSTWQNVYLRVNDDIQSRSFSAIFDQGWDSRLFIWFKTKGADPIYSYPCPLVQMRTLGYRFQRSFSYIGGPFGRIGAFAHLAPLPISDPAIKCDSNKSEYFHQKSHLIQSIFLLFLGLSGISTGWWNVWFGRMIWPWFIITLLGLVALFFGFNVILFWNDNF